MVYLIGNGGKSLKENDFTRSKPLRVRGGGGKTHPLVARGVL